MPKIEGGDRVGLEALGHGDDQRAHQADGRLTVAQVDLARPFKVRRFPPFHGVGAVGKIVEESLPDATSKPRGDQIIDLGKDDPRSISLSRTPQQSERNLNHPKFDRQGRPVKSPRSIISTPQRAGNGCPLPDRRHGPV